MITVSGELRLKIQHSCSNIFSHCFSQLDRRKLKSFSYFNLFKHHFGFIALLLLVVVGINEYFSTMVQGQDYIFGFSAGKGLWGGGGVQYFFQ